MATIRIFRTIKLLLFKISSVSITLCHTWIQIKYYCLNTIMWRPKMWMKLKLQLTCTKNVH